MALFMVFYIWIHANPTPLGIVAWNILRRTPRLQRSGPSRNEGGDPLVMSILGRKVGVAAGIFAVPFLENIVELDRLVGVKLSQLWEETSHRDWEKAGPDSNISEMPFTACAGCDYTKADSSVIKCTELRRNGLRAPGFFSC